MVAVVTVVVHQRADLDVVCCLVAAGVDQSGDYLMIPNDEDVSADLMAAGARVLDHNSGDKGLVGLNGRTHAAVCSMPESAGFDSRVLEEVDELDMMGRCRPRFTLAAVFAAIKNQVLLDMHGEAADRECARRMGSIIRGLNAQDGQRKLARVVADGVRVDDVGGFLVAMLPSGGMVGLNGSLSTRGVACGIFSDPRGTLGVVRWPQYSEPDLRLLADRVPGWFVHPAGFIAACGTHKAPKWTRPPKGTPQTSEELLGLIKEVFGCAD